MCLRYRPKYHNYFNYLVVVCMNGKELGVLESFESLAGK